MDDRTVSDGIEALVAEEHRLRDADTVGGYENELRAYQRPGSR